MNNKEMVRTLAVDVMSPYMAVCVRSKLLDVLSSPAHRRAMAGKFNVLTAGNESYEHAWTTGTGPEDGEFHLGYPPADIQFDWMVETISRARTIVWSEWIWCQAVNGMDNFRSVQRKTHGSDLWLLSGGIPFPPKWYDVFELDAPCRLCAVLVDSDESRLDTVWCFLTEDA